jgi:hypothetical protein
MNKFRWMIAISFLVLASFACQALSGGGSQAATSQAGGSGGSGGAGSGSGSSQFPMPSSVSNFTDLGNGSVNFQTKTSLKDVIAFYREAFTKKGFTERTVNTAITDTTFSMVFDGDPSGKAIVVQGVDLGNGTTNVNIRYENM